ncbi:DUF427 domain-containing protein [Deminuibacter soli]|uniref:DUF427 domain-containing protein n=1 Tax=Deminuibacter soli TaxID=2291815 RepID=A0A3E1NE48_9BACT|nr:DUF427 domain-containing protein [Deminuibacter soli]RFM26230.1 DUF427 domain-containing protein [Deminuibacter soli]
MKAIWQGAVIAESNDTIVVENNHYFPEKDVQLAYLESSEKHSICPWKGEASYYHVNVDGHKNSNAAWYYPKPRAAAQEIAGYIAFYKGVEIVP